MCKIGAIILAAGKSKRMGKPKLLLPFNGKPLITYPFQLALHHRLNPIVCVTGCYHEQIQNLFSSERDITLVFNHQFEKGMASSLKAGIHTIKEKVDAVLIFLGDQPLIPKEVVQTIIEEYKKGKLKGVKIIRPLFGKTVGHPILFDQSLFYEFDTLQGDEGGKSILKRHQASLKYLPFKNEQWGIDIDTEDEYRTLLKKD